MKKKEKRKKKNAFERIFKIAQTGSQVELTGSMSVVNNKASEVYFENEVFEIVFSSKINNQFIT